MHIGETSWMDQTGPNTTISMMLSWCVVLLLSLTGYSKAFALLLAPLIKRDHGYVTHIEIGNPLQEVEVLFDPFFANLVVFDEKVKTATKKKTVQQSEEADPPSETLTYYNREESDSYETIKKSLLDVLFLRSARVDQKMRRNKKDGNRYKGNYGLETVRWGGHGSEISKYRFGLVGAVTNKRRPVELPYAGVLGVGFPEDATRGSKTLLGAMMKAKKIKKETLAYIFPPHCKSSGYVAIGNIETPAYTDKELVFAGIPFEFVVASEPKWVVMGGVKLVKKKEHNPPVLYHNKGSVLEFDVTTPINFAPKAAIKAIVKAAGAKQESDGGYSINCEGRDKLPHLQVIISGTPFSFTGKDYFPLREEHNGQCRLFFKKAGYSDTWVWGDDFFRKCFTLFDFEGTRRMGFAPLKVSEGMKCPEEEGQKAASAAAHSTRPQRLSSSAGGNALLEGPSSVIMALLTNATTGVGGGDNGQVF